MKRIGAIGRCKIAAGLGLALVIGCAFANHGLSAYFVFHHCVNAACWASMLLPAIIIIAWAWVITRGVDLWNEEAKRRKEPPELPLR